MPTIKAYRHIPTSKGLYPEVELFDADLETAKAPYHPIRGSEPRFILEKGKTINRNLKKRKSVWITQKEDPDYLYFSCPWCLSVNKLERHYAGQLNISVWCSGKCRCHLRIDLRPAKRL